MQQGNHERATLKTCNKMDIKSESDCDNRVGSATMEQAYKVLTQMCVQVILERKAGFRART